MQNIQSIKRRKNLAIAFLICIAMLFAMVELAGEKVHADSLVDNGTCGENLTWTYDNNKTLTISGTGDMDDYEYDWYENDPVNYKGAPWTEYFDEMEKIVVEEGVTGIGNYAFTSMFKPAKKISEIILPQTLEKIGDSAFYECGNDESVSELIVALPEGLKSIGETAFASAKIKRIKIPDGVKRLNRTFDGCMYLEQIDLGKIEEIGGFTFWQCYALESITLPNTLKKIEEVAFGGTQISELVIPEGVTHLGKFYEEYGEGMPALAQCENLTKVVIPSTLTYISEREFIGCENLKEIDYRGSQQQWNELTKNQDMENLPANIVIKYDYDNDQIEKKHNPLAVKGKTAKVKYSKLKKKSQTLNVSKVIKVTRKGQGKMTYTLSSAKKGKKSFKKYFKINKTTGKVTIKKNKKMKKGTYKVKIKVKAAGNANYSASPWKTVTFKLKVK